MVNNSEHIINGIIDAFTKATAVDSKGKKTYDEVTDAVYSHIRGKSMDEQVEILRSLLEFVEGHANKIYAFMWTPIFRHLPPAIAEVVRIIYKKDKRNKNKTLAERANELLIIILENAPAAKIDARPKNLKAATKPQPNETDIPVVSKSKPQGSTNRLKYFVSKGSAALNRTIERAKKSMAPSKNRTTVAPDDKTNPALDKQIVIKHQELVYDLIMYASSVHSALLSITEILQEQDQLTPQVLADIESYSSSIVQVSGLLENAVNPPPKKIYAQDVDNLITYASNIMDVANKVEITYKQAHSTAGAKFAKENVTFATRILDSISGLISSMVNIRDAASTYISDTFQQVKKKVYTTSKAGQSVNETPLATNEKNARAEFESIATDVLDNSKQIHESQEVQTVRKSKKISSMLRSVLNSKLRSLSKKNKKLTGLINKPTTKVQSDDIEVLVDNIDANIDASNTLSITYQNATDHKPDSFDTKQSGFAAIILERTSKLVGSVKDMLRISKQKPIDPNVIDRLNGMKQQVYIKASNINDLKSD